MPRFRLLTNKLFMSLKQVDEKSNVIEEEIIDQTKTDNSSSGGCQDNDNSKQNSLWILVLVLFIFYFYAKKAFSLFHKKQFNT